MFAQFTKKTNKIKIKSKYKKLIFSTIILTSIISSNSITNLTPEKKVININIRTFDVVAPIDQKIIERSYLKLLGKKIKVYDSRTKKNYENIRLDSLVRNIYKKFYPEIWGKTNIKISKDMSNNFVIARAGIIIIKDKKRFVQSFDGKTILPIDVAVKAINDAIENYKIEQIKLKGQNYSPSIGFNLSKTAKLLFYSHPKNIFTKTNQEIKNLSTGQDKAFQIDPKSPFMIIQEIGFGQCNNKQSSKIYKIVRPGAARAHDQKILEKKLETGNNNKLYILGKKIRENLAAIGLKPKEYPEFKPYVKIAKINTFENTKIKEKLVERKKDNKSSFSQILNSLPCTRAAHRKRYYFDEISIVSAGKTGKTLKTFNL